METIELFLCIFFGHVIAVKSDILDKYQDVTFPEEFPAFFDSIGPFPFKRDFDFLPDSLFSSWKTWSPEFHMLAGLPPVMTIPIAEVFCDESKLILLVNKRSNGVTLTGEELRLGNDCYSNGELPNQFIFTYSLDQCGTKQLMQNSNTVFTNSLHLNLKDSPNNLWLTPSTLHISCIPKRSYGNQNGVVSTALPKNGKTFNIRAVNPSWTNTAESNVYKRGQEINLQVSARTGPEQQLYIQSCFVSASADPQIKPRHAVIMNKGCTAPLGSPHAAVHFVASNRADVLNFVLNTSYLLSELYIHCSVLLSDQGVTFSSKSCNYNVIQSRWEDLSGTTEVCKCCSSRCKGLSIKHLSEDAKAIVSTGPFVILDKEVATSPELSVSEQQEFIMQSDAAAAKDAIVSGATLSRCKLSSPPEGVVVLSEDPVARLTLWLPGQLQEPEHSKNLGSGSKEMQFNDTPKQQHSAKDQESLLNIKTRKTGDQSWNFLTLVSGWELPQHPDEAAIAEESQRKRWFGKSGMLSSEAPQDVDTPLQAEITVNVLNQDEFDQKDELTEMQADAAVVAQEKTEDARPIIRSKLQFSKSADGLQTVSYEEEVVKHQKAKGVTARFGMEKNKAQQEHRHGGMLSAFLDLTRRINKEE
ncbi:zona pellucida protein C [Notolabrus celidotus]|uniref:zona pellucida protein C n=1 Tax=Notolabrus celidotus TaxID=1203425 RepID=UPI00148FCB76|nr:zona pellucida protein C [Notolabrus celidotus]